MINLLPSFQSVHRQERLDRIFKSPSELVFQRWKKPVVVVVKQETSSTNLDSIRIDPTLSPPHHPH